MTAARSTALDGLRGCAVTAVLAYHAHYSWARGGFLGVDMFFVLSGYLITSGLLRLQLAHGQRLTTVYARFLARRAARLVPALLAAVGCVSALTLLVGTAQERARLGSCTLAATGYWMNLPAGERLHCAASWHVTWSLAAEEQFYVGWPLVLAASVGVARRRSRNAPVLVAAVASALYVAGLLWQVWLRAAAPSTARVLFAPDGRSLVLLVGCALAAAPAIATLTRRRRCGAAYLGAVVLAVDLALAGAGPGYPTMACLLLAAVATAAVITGITGAQQNFVSRVLGSRLPAGLGRHAYSLYLVHEIAFRVTDGVATRGTLTYELVRWPLCAVAAVASYRLVERPCQRRLNRLLDRSAAVLNDRDDAVPARPLCVGP